jgi:chromosome segregation protein
MPYPKGQHPGTTWRKVDFQCHSPRDRAWTDPPDLPGGTPPLEVARANWAKSLIGQCRTVKLGAIAITDHHDITFVPYVQTAAVGSGVLIFPGIEVTCNDNAQCLAIFDPATGPDIWNHFLGKLKDIAVAPANDSKTRPITNANMTVAELFHEVADDAQLREACILLPHFSDGDAHKHLNEDGHHLRFAGLSCDGVYVEKAYKDLDPETLRKAYGEVPEWGTRRKAVVATGDNRNPQWSRLGCHDCWIKLGEDSVEAVRQALLADEARVTYEHPVQPSERIVELEIKSTLTGETAIKISFNPGFNAFIGGRGSGKSAILEYLKFGLARTERDLGRPESREREEQLIEETLTEGYVAVVLEREGVRETWHRDLHEEKITIFHADGTESYITLADARRRFRGRAFFQKQLSTTTRESSSATDQITGIAAAEALDRRREIDQAIENTKRDVTTTLQRVAAHWQINLERNQAKARVDDLKKRIDNINLRLKEEGISAVDLAVIADAPRHTRGKNYLAQVSKHIDSERTRIGAIINTTLNIPNGAVLGCRNIPRTCFPRHRYRAGARSHRGAPRRRDPAALHAHPLL